MPNDNPIDTPPLDSPSGSTPASPEPDPALAANPYRDAIVELLASKKVMLAFFTGIAWLAGHLGLHMDPAAALAMCSPLLMAIAGLALADHGKSAATIQRRTTLEMHGRIPLARPNRALCTATAVSAIAFVAILGSAVISNGCRGAGGTGTGGGSGSGVIGSIEQGGSDFLQCEGVNLTKAVTGGTLIGVVGIDLVQANYADLIASLIATLGNTTVGCAVLAVQEVANGGKSNGAAFFTPMQAHAAEMTRKYGWKLKPTSSAMLNWLSDPLAVCDRLTRTGARWDVHGGTLRIYPDEPMQDTIGSSIIWADAEASDYRELVRIPRFEVLKGAGVYTEVK